MSVVDDPRWLSDRISPGRIVPGDANLMELAIDVAAANIEHTTGGPFGALVATDEGEIVSIGYNRVVPLNDSTAHAEMLALRRAEQHFRSFRLRGTGLPRLSLITTCAPCIMCAGAIHWAGIPRVVAALRKSDIEKLGFIEGPRAFDVAEFFGERGIDYVFDVARAAAREMLERYEGEIYNG